MRLPENKLYEPFLIVLFSAVVLVALSVFNTGGRIGEYELKKINLLADVQWQGSLFNAPVSAKQLADSHLKKMKKSSDEGKIQLADNKGIIDYCKDSTRSLSRFFRALVETKKNHKKARIAYFGDSMIEGDLITQDLRSLFQQAFGGKGVGFVPITSITAGFRQTITHTFSDNWQDYNLLDKTSTEHPLGITGHVFSPYSNLASDSTLGSLDQLSWVKYAAVNREGLDKFFTVNQGIDLAAKEIPVKSNLETFVGAQ